MNVVFDWESILVNASDLIAFLRKNRTEKVGVIFHYADAVYTTGVNPENQREPFYFDGDTYPSMFAYCSGACIDGGFLLPDLQQPLRILAVNGEDPKKYFQI